MDYINLPITGLITIVLVGLGRYYFNSLSSKLKSHETSIKKLMEENGKLSKELELNKQADTYRSKQFETSLRGLEEGQRTMIATMQNFLKDYGFVLEKLKAQELSKG